MQRREREQKPGGKSLAVPPDAACGCVDDRHRADRKEHCHDARVEGPRAQGLGKLRAAWCGRDEAREDAGMRERGGRGDEVEIEASVVEEVRVGVAEGEGDRAAERVELVRVVGEEVAAVRQAPGDADQPQRESDRQHHRESGHAAELPAATALKL